ncbi:MAG TPA: trypsin-like peptidase domain-containing protein [Candidatus Eisenbacteria bacterium]|jgi:S1-C subfamily serine protease
MQSDRPRASGVLGFLVVLLSVPPVGVAVAVEQDAEQAFREARAYTVRIRTQITTPFIGDERGTFEGAGFLVDTERRWIVTNAHVVGQSPSLVQIAFAGQAFQPAHKVYVDPFTDVAVLVVDRIPAGRTAAQLGCGDAARIGEPVGAFGHPLGMHFTGTRGIVSGKTDRFGPNLLQVDATVDHGNSGGPVIALDDRRVVGIATARAADDKADRVNFATPMKDVCRILALLRDGVSPSPARLEFSLLRDEDGRHTLRVARSFDRKRWPLESGDRIVAVNTQGDSLGSLSDLVTALRGRTGRIVLVVEHQGRRRTVEVAPLPREPVTARRGVSVDGALIAPIYLEDDASLRDPARLVVQSVESGSAAEMLEVEEQDILQSIDGRSFADLDALEEYLRQRPKGRAMKVVLRRWSGGEDRIFDYHVRDLPGEDIQLVGPETDLVTAKHH